MLKRKPKAFISTSLRKEDENFCDLIIGIVRRNNFDPFGTVGKFSQSPQSLLSHMIENIQNSDCVVMVATPRYIQIDLHDVSNKKLSISELVEFEGFIGTILGKPVLIFLQEGVNINSVFKSTTQYIELKTDGSDLNAKSQLIEDYFKNTLNIIEKNKSAVSKQVIQKTPVFKGEKSLFVGRKKEIENISKIILDTNKKGPISIVGIGGIGKSTLSYKVIHACEKSFDLILTINGEKNLSFNSFLLKIGNYIGPPQKPEMDLDIDQYRETILRTLGNQKNILFFFDNYDIVNSPEIYDFLEELPENVKLMITSRNRSNLTGEEVIDIEGLEIDDGQKLFLEITKKHFKKSPSNEFLNKLKEVLNSIECHPLAVKLLAGSYHGEGTIELERISSELVKLTNYKEQGLSKSVKACLDFSFDNLTALEKKCLLDLSIFTSPFPKEAAQFVVNIDKEVLYGLYDKNFLRRYEIENPAVAIASIFLYDIHPVIRKFLEYYTESSIEGSKLEKLSKFYYSFVIQAYQQIGKISRHHYYYGIIDMITREAHNDIDIAMNNLPELREKSFMCNRLGQTLHQIGYPKKAIHYYLKNLLYDIDDGDAVRIGNDYQNIGVILEEHGNYIFALINHLKSRDNYTKGHDYVRILDAEIHIALCLIRLNKTEIAFSMFKNMYESLKILEGKIPPEQYYMSLIRFYSPLSYYFQIRKNYLCSLACLQKMAFPLSVIDNQYLLGDHYSNLAIIYQNIGDRMETIRHLELALDAYKKINALEHMSYCCDQLVELYGPGNNVQSEKYRQMSESIKKNPNFDGKKLRAHLIQGRQRS